MAGGNGILGGYGLRQHVKPQRLWDIENYVHALANQSLQMDSSGNVDITGVINIGTSGGIYQGTGTFAVPNTGLKIYNSGGFGILETWGSNGAGGWEKQVYLDTSGVIYAGAGDVRLDKNGLTLQNGTSGTWGSISASNKVIWGLSTNVGEIGVTSYNSGPNTIKLMKLLAQGTSSTDYGWISLEAESGDRGAVINVQGTGTARVQLSGKSTGTGADLTVDSDGHTTVAGGLNVGTATAATTAGEIAYSDDLEPLRGGVSYTGYVFVPLTTPLTSTSWDGDSYSTVGTSTQLDLSAVFGAPANIKAVLMEISNMDSAAWGTGSLEFACGPSSTYYYAVSARCYGGDILSSHTVVVPCDANGDVWYRIAASGASTMDITLRIYGYWL